MNLRKALAHPLFQYSLELALPLIGYLFLEWTLPVIIAFYFFDFFGAEFARYRRHKKVFEVNSAASKSLLTTSGLVALVVIVLTTSQALYIMSQIESQHALQPIDQIVAFIQSEGWLLLPLVMFAAHLKDKMTFYMPKKYYDYSFDKLIKNFFLEITVLLLLVVGGLLAYSFLHQKVDPFVMLGLFILVKLAFDFGLAKRLNEKSKS